MATFSLIDALNEPVLFAPFFKSGTWRRWRVFIKALFALPMDADELAIYEQHTGRTDAPTKPYTEAALVVGRRGGWLHNALTENKRLPFHAIIAAENPTGDQAVLLVDHVDELHPLMNVPSDCAVPRDAASLSAAMKEMLRFGTRILFVDPFYDPFNARYKNTLRECLGVVKSLNPQAVCEIHYRHHCDKPASDTLTREAANLFPGVVPDGMVVTIFCWREKTGGADFHARYLLTDKGGIRIDAGFSAEGAHQTTDMHLMSFGFSQEKLKSFERGATDYELVEPVIRVSGDGQVENIN